MRLLFVNRRHVLAMGQVCPAAVHCGRFTQYPLLKN